MPTENRRIATYFPKDIEEKFTVFKLERGIRGDSQALLTIVSEFLGVTQGVAHSSSPDLLSRIESLEEVHSSSSDLLSQFQGLEKLVFQIQEDLAQIQSVPKFLDKQESQESVQQVIPVVPGQLNFLEPVIESSISVDLESELRSRSPSRLTGSEMSKRLGITPKQLSARRSKRTPAVFAEWLRGVDPNGIAWQYDLEKKVYFSVQSVQETLVDCQDF